MQQVVAELFGSSNPGNGWHPGAAGQHYYWGGSSSGSWPTWSSVQASTGPVDGAAGDGDGPATQPDTTTDGTDGPGDGQWQQQPWQGQSWSSASWGQGGWQGRDWQSWGWWQPTSTTKGDFSDPPTWGGWASYRLWKKALARWDQNTDVPVWRRFEKLSKQLDWDLQSRLEHVDEKVLAGPGYLQAIFGILDGIAGEKDVSEKRRVVRAALFEGQRKKDETLSFAGADRYLTIPSELKAFILEETAALSRQGVQNLRTLTGGAADFDKMVGALKTLDVEEEPLTRGKGSFLTGAAQSDDGDEADGQDDEGSEASLEDTERVEAFLAEVSGVEEGVALEMLAAFEKEAGNQPPRRRTWKQNKDRKLAAKKDRRVFSRPRVSMSDLKERTRCANCGERGHWQAERKRPYRSKGERARAENRRR